MITGGGTAGHVYPALTIAEQLEEAGLATRDEMLYVGSKNGMEASLASAHNIEFQSVPTAPVAGRSWLRLPGAALRIIAGIWGGFRLARRFKPAVLLATGGYVSVPALLGARLNRVKTVIYLPDIQPGLAVRFLARFAEAIAVTDEAARGRLPSEKVVVTGYPVRAAFGKINATSARKALDLDPGLPAVLVLGGSQGAHSINNAIRGSLLTLLESMQLIHVAGERDIEEMIRARDLLPPDLLNRYNLHAYLDKEMPIAFAAADLVVCRAGASVLGELPIAGKPAILIPGGFASGHQIENARRLVDAGAGALLRDEQVDRLPSLLLQMIAEPDRLESMAAAARAMARPDAAERIANLLASVAQGNRGDT